MEPLKLTAFIFMTYKCLLSESLPDIFYIPLFFKIASKEKKKPFEVNIYLSRLGVNRLKRGDAFNSESRNLYYGRFSA